ncbi:MAG: S8 family serine peptidase, partial [Planctomycetota bacterium]
MLQKGSYKWSMYSLVLMALLGVVFSSDAKAGCEGIDPITSVEDFCDVRCKDMSSIDISDRPNLPARLTFNQGTIWPGPAQMPAGCDPNVIMTNGMNPGLGVRALHQQGITGTGVNVAIIDQAMYLDHPEFAGKITTYYDLAAGEQSSMHGPAVTSLLVGTNCGTAPGARVYYCAVRSWVYEVDYAQALNWIVQQNESLPDSEKIRVVSVSAAPGVAGILSEPGEPTWVEAYAQAQAAGILVLDCSSERGFIGRCWYDVNDPENVAKCTPGRRPGESWFDPADILTPASLRTTAEEAFQGDHSYIYWSSAGTSWTRPYCAGVLAMGWQIRPELTKEQMIDLLFQTAYVNPDGAKIINPPAFISSLNSDKPVIGIDTTEIDFYAVTGEGNPGHQILSISNIGFGTLNWVLDYDCNWLNVEPNSGSSIGFSDVNEVTITVTDISVIPRSCELVISDPCATNSPQTVTVNLYLSTPYDGINHVPSEYETIRAAINDSNEGDIVVIEPGTYTGAGNKDLDFNGKAITVRSTDPNNPCIVASTIIDCNGSESEPHRGFHFHSNEDANSVLNGITITGGYAAYGGAIYCDNSSPTVLNCALVDNSAAYGGGMRNSNSSATVVNCIFVGNSAVNWGGGMTNRDCTSSLTVINCTFTNNLASWGAG